MKSKSKSKKRLSRQNSRKSLKGNRQSSKDILQVVSNSSMNDDISSPSVVRAKSIPLPRIISNSKRKFVVHRTERPFSS